MINKHKIIIVEDEAAIALDIEMRVKRLGFEVSAVILKANHVIRSVEENMPDVVLMDINLKGVDLGIDLAEEIMRNYEIPVIFLTAFTDQQTFSKALKTNPFGYLSKPFKDVDLKNSIRLALNQKQVVKQTQDSNKELNQRIYELSTAKPENRSTIFLKDGKGYVNVRLAEVLWIKAEDTYSKIVTEKGEILVNSLLGELELKLSEEGFVRVHRSYIVSITQVEKILTDDVLIHGVEIPISKSYKKSLINRIS